MKAHTNGNTVLPKVQPEPQLTRNRWYFDVISTSSRNESASIVFFNAGLEGFSRGDETDDRPFSVVISGTFANGTHFNFREYADHGVEITDSSHGLKGEWKGTGVTFQGTDLHRRDVIHTVTIDSPETGVKGMIKMLSVCSRYSVSMLRLA
jgi:hypothetical protein